MLEQVTSSQRYRLMFWILSIHQQVKKLLRRCVTCNKLTGKPYTAPDPPPLPKVHVKQCRPFTITGVDFTGALFVREGRGEERKVYICLFAYASTRAVYIEVVPDLTAESFLLAFRKFSSRKSLPSKMLSDNASTFLAAADEPHQLFESDKIKESLQCQKVTWELIPKWAPWYGGFWERLIGLTKNAIKKTLGRSFISLAELETIATEIEVILNNRPLTYTFPQIIWIQNDSPRPTYFVADD